MADEPQECVAMMTMEICVWCDVMWMVGIVEVDGWMMGMVGW